MTNLRGGVLVPSKLHVEVPMRFGFMEDFRNPLPWRRPFPDLYRAILDQICRAEEIGYDDI